MKTLRVMGLVVMSIGLLSGCETMPDDDRTRAEGAAAGALIGALLGYAVDRERGAAIGALVGGGAGLAVGDQIARRKQAYATTEDFLDAQIAATAQLNAEARTHNAGLRRESSRLEREAQALRTRYDAGRVQRSSLVSKRNEVNEQLQSSRQLEQVLTEELEIQSTIARQEREQRPRNDPYVARLDREVQALQRNLEQLRAGNEQLASIDQRLSV